VSADTDFAVPPVSTREFAADAAWEGSSIVLQFRGTADMDACAPLGAFVIGVHREAQRVGVERVIIDFHRLEFMNSSCFKEFIAWFGDLVELPPEKQYRIHFRSNGAMLWQRRSLHALRCFAIDLVTVESS
jgi:hypothetical protein